MKLQAKLILALALGLGMAGCVTTETVNNKGGGSPAGGSSGDSVSSVSSQVSPAEEKRRRARIRLELAVSHYQSANMPLALQEIDQAIKIDPDYAAAWGMRALVYAAMNDGERADANFRQGLKLTPKDPEQQLRLVPVPDRTPARGHPLLRRGRCRPHLRHAGQAAAQCRHLPDAGG